MKLVYQFEGDTWESVLVPAAELATKGSMARAIRVGSMVTNYEKTSYYARVYEAETMA